MTDYDKNSWITPPHIIELARQVMGSIDLDPASSARAQEVVKATYWCGLDQPLSARRNGLALEWLGNVWLNPPYGRGLIEDWVDRVAGGEGYDQAVVLANAATGTIWFHTLLETCDAVCLTMGRLAFLHPETLKPVKGNNCAQAIFYFGTKTEVFAESFAEIGAVLRG